MFLKILDVFQSGGVMMYAILLFSCLGMAVFIERIKVVTSSGLKIEVFMYQIRKLLSEKKLDDAIQLCGTTRGAVPRVIRSGLLMFKNKKYRRIEKSFEEAILYEIPKLEKNVAWLGITASISPLLGLTGTVLGLVAAFQKLGIATQGYTDPSQLAGGIYQALYTTIFGLFVGIPAFVAYEYLNMKINIITMDMEKTSTETLNILQEQSECK